MSSVVGEPGSAWSSGTCHLHLRGPAGQSPRPKLRLHIDISPTDRDQEAKLERLVRLVAPCTHRSERSESWHVLLDPEGDDFASCSAV
ncbi:VOC family protein [Cellulomonas sp. Leaf334]|uniref:VOC family protein n=1 Tax=Cellulomonas sp. Leaf334 TaxID=1736339 RepID=UPI000AB50C70|nr:VOC family protein [Cellulomonas sp. Leaf334]